MSTILKAEIQALINSASISTSSSDLAILRLTGQRLNCDLSNLDIVSLALGDSTTSATPLLEMGIRAKALPENISTPTAQQPTIELGGIGYFSTTTPYDFQKNGARYLRTGFIETNASLFDAEFFKMSINSRRVGVQSSLSLGVYGGSWGGGASNGTTATVAITSVAIRNSDNSLTGPRVALSSDGGATFQTPQTLTGFSDSLYVSGVLYAASKFIVYGDGGRVVTSADGVSWALQPSTTASKILNMKWNGSVFIYTTSNSVIRSTDLLTATANSTNIPSTPTRITFNYDVPSTWVIAGTNPINGISRSTDNGVNWSLLSGPAEATGSCLFLEYANGFYYIGYAAGVYRSTDLITWTKQSSSNSSRFFYDREKNVFVSPGGLVTEDFKSIQNHGTLVTDGQHIVPYADTYMVLGLNGSTFEVHRSNRAAYAGSITAIDSGSSNLAKGFVRIS